MHCETNETNWGTGGGKQRWALVPENQLKVTAGSGGGDGSESAMVGRCSKTPRQRANQTCFFLNDGRCAEFTRTGGREKLPIA